MKPFLGVPVNPNSLRISENGFRIGMILDLEFQGVKSRLLVYSSLPVIIMVVERLVFVDFEVIQNEIESYRF